MGEAIGWNGRFTPFDASEFLDSEDAIAEYLAAALADPDPGLLIATLEDIAKLQIAPQSSALHQIDDAAP